MWKCSRFAVVGCMGFIVDFGVYNVFQLVLDNPMQSRIVAFWIAATATWLGNRLFTYSYIHFSNEIRKKSIQLAKHLVSAHFSGAFNIATFWLLLPHTSELVGFIAGVIIGMFSNYFLSCRFVYVSN